MVYIRMKNDVQIAIRLPKRLLSRIDRYAKTAIQTPLSRAAAVRVLVESGFDMIELLDGHCSEDEKIGPKKTSRARR